MSENQQKSELKTPEIPGYRILGKLGKGGMATVYLANQESFDREVALKVMAPILAADSSYGDRFMREARIAARFSHPNIIAVYDVGVQNDHYYIGMEYHPGGDLKSRIKKGMTTREAMSILRQMAAALDYAHSKGYIHRDVKPDNILFREDGSAVLTDFGIARPASGDTQMTQLGMVVGTPKYMSPEQARGQALDARSDIYSLGIVFYETLMGKVPFTGKDSIDIGIKHVKDPVPPLSQNLQALQPLIDRMLAKNASDRYSRGRELIVELDQLRMGALRNQNRGDSGQVRAVDADRAIPTTPRQAPASRGPLDDTIPPAPVEEAHREPRLGLLLTSVVVVGGAYMLYASGVLTPLWQQLSDKMGLDNSAISGTASTDANQPPLDAAQTRFAADVDRASRLAATSIGSTINSTLYPMALPGDVLAASAAHELADIEPDALPEVDVQTRIVNEMLTEADTLIAAGRLVSPPGSNALESYRGVLTLDENNATALAGLKAIAMHYLELTDKTLAAGSLEPARQYLQQAQDIAPDMPEVALRQQRLDEAMQDQQAQVAKARADAERSRQPEEKEPPPAPRVNRADAMLGRFKVKGLLRSAEYDLAENRYTSPAGNNALQKYREALRLSPGNAQARQGLRALSRTLESNLDQALEAGDTALAMSILQELKLVNPNNPRIQQATDLVTGSAGGAAPTPPGDG